MYLNAHIQVTVISNTTGDTIALKSICSVNKKQDGHALGAECELTVPMNCVIQYKDGQHDYLTQYTVNTQAAFSVGDQISITANYDGYLTQTIFNGFITDFVFGNPMKIKCMDYQYFFNLGIFGQARGASVKINKKKKSPTFQTFGCNYKSITLKDLLTNVIGFVNDTIDIKCANADHINLVLPMPDIELVNITFSMMTPASICQYFIKELGLVVTLRGSDLYVNIASNTTAVINYATNRNVIISDLQKPASTFQTYKVKAWFYQPTGKKDSIEIGDSNGQQRDVYFYRVKQDADVYNKLATEALNKIKQMRFNGTITTYLYPEPLLFAKAVYTDIRYPDRTGNYVITHIETTIDTGGYRHKLKLAYLTDLNDTTKL
jgi:hypothetical protein